MKTIGVGIIGYGKVGRGTARALLASAPTIAARTGADVRVAAVCRRSPVPLAELPAGARACIDWRQIITADDVYIVVETMGGTSVAREALLAALRARKPIVTANKNLVAEHGDELFTLAREMNLPIGMEGAVAGAIPIVRVLSEAMACDRVVALNGILNGTANFILTQMETQHCSFAAALQQAQEAGFAELDPTLDVDGIDARDKLCILVRLAFGGRLAPNAIPTRGIRQVRPVDIHYAHRLGGTIRLVGSVARNGAGYELGVEPWLVSEGSLLGSVQGAQNAVLVHSERAGTQMLYGSGAGGESTGAAVAANVAEIARAVTKRTLRFHPNGAFPAADELQACASPRSVSWYMRMTVRDRPGIVARVAAVLAEQHINIDSVVQEPGMSKAHLSFVVTLEPTSRLNLDRAIAEIDRMDFLSEPVMLLRMELENPRCYTQS